MSRAFIPHLHVSLRHGISQSKRAEIFQVQTFPLTRLTKEPASRLISRLTSNHCMAIILPEKHRGRGVYKLFSLRESYIGECVIFYLPAQDLRSSSSIDNSTGRTAKTSVRVDESVSKHPADRFLPRGERELQGKLPTPAENPRLVLVSRLPFQGPILHLSISYPVEARASVNSKPKPTVGWELARRLYPHDPSSGTEA